MTRINTDQPSSGKPLQLFVPATSNGGFVSTSWATLAEAPDFSVPSTSDGGVTLDPVDNGRELRAGEVFFETPLQAVNSTVTTRWIELQMLLQGSSGEAIPLSPRVPVPAGDSIFLSIQGLRLLKTNFGAVAGDRLQIRAEVGNAIKVIGSAVELEAQNHAPDTEAI
jgi:hypothetical protein